MNVSKRLIPNWPYASTYVQVIVMSYDSARISESYIYIYNYIYKLCLGSTNDMFFLMDICLILSHQLL